MARRGFIHIELANWRATDNPLAAAPSDTVNKRERGGVAQIHAHQLADCRATDK